jgi:hypothetical protein
MVRSRLLFNLRLTCTSRQICSGVGVRPRPPCASCSEGTHGATAQASGLAFGPRLPGWAGRTLLASAALAALKRKATETLAPAHAPAAASALADVASVSSRTSTVAATFGARAT